MAERYVKLGRNGISFQPADEHVGAQRSGLGQGLAVRCHGSNHGAGSVDEPRYVFLLTIALPSATGQDEESGRGFLVMALRIVQRSTNRQRHRYLTASLLHGLADIIRSGDEQRIHGAEGTRSNVYGGSKDPANINL